MSLLLLASLILCDHFLGVHSDTVSSAIFKNLSDVADKLPRDYCTYQFLILNESLSRGEEWALRMIDAWAKPQSGILEGNFYHMGNYDECLEIKGQEVEGKYCTAFLSPHSNLTNEISDSMKGLTSDQKSMLGNFQLPYGLCVPKVCTIDILQNISDVLVESFEYPWQFHFSEDFCDGGDPRPYTTSAVVAIIIFTVFAFAIVFSTWYDAFVYRKLNETERQPDLLVTFSVLTNGQKLFDTKSSIGDLGCLNGLRVISMMWVVLGHGFQRIVTLPLVNAFHVIEKFKESTVNNVFLAAPMAVDTFLVVGGLLVVYLFMKSHHRGVRFSLPMYYLHRILRLTPALAMLVLFASTLWVYMGNGPFWSTIESTQQKGCQDNWWHVLLYLQNYITPFHNQCLSHTWYLAVDTQMYFLAPLAFFPLLKWPKSTIAVLCVLILGMTGYAFAITMIKQLGSVVFDEIDMYTLIYYPTHTRGAVYIAGMICGYFVYTTKTSSPLKLTQSRVVLLWVLALGLMLGIVFSHSSMIDNEDPLNAAFFNTFTRLGWAIGLGIIIILCVNGYGGLIDTFLSHKIFTVLIRLNYCIYLLHVITMVTVITQERTPDYFYMLFMMRRFWGDYMFAVGAAVVWSLAFESPVLAIEKIVFAKKRDANKGVNVLENGKTSEEPVVDLVINDK